jgi:hypothetical protein
MRLKGLSIKELKTLENKLKKDIAQTEKNLVAHDIFEYNIALLQ